MGDEASDRGQSSGQDDRGPSLSADTQSGYPTEAEGQTGTAPMPLPVQQDPSPSMILA